MNKDSHYPSLESLFREITYNEIHFSVLYMKSYGTHSPNEQAVAHKKSLISIKYQIYNTTNQSNYIAGISAITVQPRQSPMYTHAAQENKGWTEE